ncbi:MAG: NAD-dependent epimerase/dehydratase family protein [Planctomycetes bacterium]|nr:NAD-dependent epimerase/dehydratase family protein [Planctomycetota bacterium]
MRVLITGGSGFIGSHLTESLLADGHQVLVIDNLSTGRADNLEPHDSLEVVNETIADGAAVLAIFHRFKPEQVAHAAASYKDPENWTEDTLTNALGTANVVKAAMAHEVKRFVYFQTALCYGSKPLEHPITLKHPRLPDCSYAISKTAGEEYLEMSGLNYVTLRLANIIGPRNLSGPLPAFFKRLTTGKECTVFRTRRDFIFVDDLVRLVRLALDGKGPSGTYHASTGQDTAIKELYDGVAKALGLDVPCKEADPGPDDAPTILLDPSETHANFEWRAETPLEDIISAAVKWYKEKGLKEFYTHLKLEEAKS